MKADGYSNEEVKMKDEPDIITSPPNSLNNLSSENDVIL